jgi:hypothetical protein
MLSASNAAPARQQAVLLVKLLPLMSGLLIILPPSAVASMAPLAVVVFAPILVLIWVSSFDPFSSHIAGGSPFVVDGWRPRMRRCAAASKMRLTFKQPGILGGRAMRTIRFPQKRWAGSERVQSGANLRAANVDKKMGGDPC